MLAEFQAQAAILPGKIRLDWQWVGLEPWPMQRIVRRCLAYPSAPGDGFAVLDLTELLDANGRPWDRVERSFYFSHRNPAYSAATADQSAASTPLSLAEDGVIQAELALCFKDTSPARVIVICHDSGADAPIVALLDTVTRVERKSVGSDGSRTETISIFVAGTGGEEVLAGRVVVSCVPAPLASRFEWSPAALPSVGVAFERHELQLTVSSVIERTAERLSASFETSMAADSQRPPLRTVNLNAVFDADSGEWRSRGTLLEQGLRAETIHYYALFTADPGTTGGFRSEPDGRAAATPVRFYGMDRRLYGMLPAAVQRYDEPEPDLARQEQGQLRRLLQVFGAGLDQVRSQAEGLRTRHDVLNVHADLLPRLAHWIGWDYDQTLGELAQRNAILSAPEVYTTVGTAPNLRALVQRVTGWQCQVKEFVHNVFLSNAPESVRLWEIWEQRFDGRSWARSPTPISRSEGFHGRPAAAVDNAGVTWLFWHADGDGERRILLQRFDGAAMVDPQPRQAMPGGAGCSDEHPAVVARDGKIWLFWDSNRDGNWNIYTTMYRLGPNGSPTPGEIQKLTDHPAQDCCPAAACDREGRIWLFWQSNRRGPTDIWVRIYDGSAWGNPLRLTTAKLRDLMPTTASDSDNRLWLFWGADLGDRSALFGQFHSEGQWSQPQKLTEGLQRDESPHAITHDHKLWLFWHSDRDGRWQIHCRCRKDERWGEPFAVTCGPGSHKEPAVVADGARLRLFYRSQLRGEAHKSRTVDCNDLEMLSAMRTFRDRAHYTYDTGSGDDDWYARDTVGLYLSPDTQEEHLILHNRRLLEGPLQRFLPIQVRPVFVIDLQTDERVYTYAFPDAKPPRTIGESYADALTTVAAEPYPWPTETDAYEDAIREWIWLRSWHEGADARHRSVDFSATPVDTRSRTWHVGVKEGG